MAKRKNMKPTLANIKKQCLNRTEWIVQRYMEAQQENKERKTAYNNIHKIRDPNSFHVRRNGARIASSKIRPCRNDSPSNILGHLLYLDQRNFPMTAMVDRHGPIHHLIRNICVALKRFTRPTLLPSFNSS